MFHGKVQRNLEKTSPFKWFMMSMLAGHINAGGFLTAGQFVTHVTGFSTLFGIDLAKGDWKRAVGFLTVPVFFLIGSGLSGYLVDVQFHRGKKPLYDRVMFLQFICLSIVAIAGYFEFFGLISPALEVREELMIIWLLCLASGLQNGAITVSTGARLRTTHLTGLTTDLGLGLVRIFTIKTLNAIRKEEVRANWFRFGTLMSFILGSTLGAYLHFQVKHLGFLFPAAISFYAFLEARKMKK